MSNVITKTDESTETVTEPPCHYTCHFCHPEKFLGMPAVCGAELLGIDAPDDAGLCEDCGEQWAPHLVDVHGYPPEWLL